MLVVDCFGLAVFTVDCVVSRTVSQLLLVTCLLSFLLM